MINVLQWSNIWDAVGVLGLSTKNLPLLQEFIEYVGTFKDTEFEYSAVPKEFVVEDTNLTTILRNVHRNIDLETFPLVLYRRNPGLRGGGTTSHPLQGLRRRGQNPSGGPKGGLETTFLERMPHFPPEAS